MPLPSSQPLASLCRLWQRCGGKWSLIREDVLVSLQAVGPRGWKPWALKISCVYISGRNSQPQTPKHLHVKYISE